MSATTLKGKALRDAERLARGELAHLATTTDVGELVRVEDLDAHTHTLFFVCNKAAYPGWVWAVTISRLTPRARITVNELALLPDTDALTAPAWVPWAKRLADYREAQAAAASAEVAQAQQAALEVTATPAEAEAEYNLLENDFSDFDDELDGVDVEAAAAAAASPNESAAQAQNQDT